MHINLPTGGIDAHGQLSTGLDHDNLLTQYINKGLVHGYSVARKLVDVSTNLQAFRVRRSNDDAEQDIGFIGNEVNISSATDFTGTNNGFLRTIYDQVGSQDLSKTVLADQLRIISEPGSVDTIEGKIAAKSVLSDSPYDNVSSVNLSDLTIFAVYASNETTGFIVMVQSGGAADDAAFHNLTPDRLELRTNTNAANTGNNSLILNSGELYSACFTHTAAGDVSFWSDNVFLSSGSLIASALLTFDKAFRFNSGASLSYMSEVLIFNTVLNETDRYTVNKNINDFYGI